MHKMRTHNKNSLFLMELLLSLLFLSLSCAAVLRPFAAAYKNRTEARRNNHIQTLATSTAELLEGWDGDYLLLADMFPDAAESTGCLVTYYDKSWEVCSKKEHQYQLLIYPDVNTLTRGALVNIKDSKGTLLYSIDVCFPNEIRKEGADES